MSVHSSRQVKPIALRDLIEGREFEINDHDYCEDDYDIDEEYDNDIIQDYINIDALDLDVDENDKVICFANLRKKMKPVTSDGRIMKRLKKQGLGEIVPSTSVVYYHYSAYVNLQEEPFDNSYLRGKKPERLVLEKGPVILGFEIALKTMRKGEVSQFIVEPEYAFGNLGCPPRVPPEATVLFEIEMVDFVEVSNADEISHDENEDVSEKFERLYKVAKDNHSLGNDAFQKNNYKMAAVRYTRARDILMDVICKGEEDEKMKYDLLLKVFSNLAICYNKMNKPNQACMACQQAFYFNKEEALKNPKLCYNWGLALMDFGEYYVAKNKFKAALRILPNNEEIKEALKKLEVKQKQYNEQSKLMFRKAFGYKEEAGNKPTEKNSELKEEMISILKQKFEEAKSGRTEIMLPTEVLDSVIDMCEELASRDVQFFRSRNKLIISRRL